MDLSLKGTKEHPITAIIQRLVSILRISLHLYSNLENLYRKRINILDIRSASIPSSAEPGAGNDKDKCGNEKKEGVKRESGLFALRNGACPGI
ncbi:MAG TPA: hypothetical protein VMW10_02300 [Alphaproteobacteria bacterium]|nr:hypothetical protein [Alphaproteobacteria bacterium]